jgi:transcription initiation factor TFIIIB Brf1 subunit/transcription initiation factor TFIIB/DNA-binding CsgD family transcriptional regulator
MNYCEECGGSLIKANQSEYYVCANCGLVSNIAIIEVIPKIDTNRAKRTNNYTYPSYSRVLERLKISKKYKRKISDEILVKAKIFLENEENIQEVRKKIYREIRSKGLNSIDNSLIKIAKEYKNLARIFLNGNGSEEIFEAIALLYYSKKKNIKLSIRKISKIFNISKNNLFRRYKEFEKRIKIYERFNIKKLIILKLLGQNRLKFLTLKELALIANVRYDSARATQMRIKKKLGNIVDSQVLLGLLISSQ